MGQVSCAGHKVQTGGMHVRATVSCAQTLLYGMHLLTQMDAKIAKTCLRTHPC